jgi:hypothetical protein
VVVLLASASLWGLAGIKKAMHRKFRLDRQPSDSLR